MSNEFTCAMCRETYQKQNDDEWSDEKAQEELEANFGKSNEPVDIVCDDCYQKIKPVPHAEIHVEQQPNCVGCLYSYLKSDWLKEQDDNSQT